MRSYTRLIVIGISAVALTGLTLPAMADVITTTFQDGVGGYTGTQDNTLYTSPNNWKNAGASGTIEASSYKGILSFDISSLSGQYSSIISAQLILSGSGKGSSNVISLYQIADANAGWFEGTQGFANAAAGESNWYYKASDPTVAANRVPWAGGANGLGVANTDYLTPALVDSFAIDTGTDAAGTKYTFNLASTVIEHWLTTANAGILLVRAPSGTGVAQFYSSNAATTADHPELKITYSTVPEPASLSLLALGGLALLRRRR